MFEKKIGSNIEEFKQFALVTARQLVSGAGAPKTYEEYLAVVRMPINNGLIGLAVGGEILEGKKGHVLKFNYKLPTKKDLADIKPIIDTFITTVEEPFLATLPKVENDMDVLTKDGRNGTDGINVPKLDKVSAKVFRNHVFGQDGHASLSRELLNGNDLLELAALGDELRKRKNVTTALIIGGISLLVIGGVTAGVIIYNNKKNDDIDEDFADLDLDLPDESLETDVAHVEMA